MTQSFLPVDAAGCVAPARQTRIGAFLMSAHGAHMRRLALAMPGPVQNAAGAELHAQFCRETEIVSLLARSVSWSFQPMLPMQSWQWEMAWMPRSAQGVDDPALAALIDVAAFGHALHAAIRPAAILPLEAKPDDPFNAALHRIEADSSRLLQAQIVFLKGPALAHLRGPMEEAVGFRHSQVARLWAEVIA